MLLLQHFRAVHKAGNVIISRQRETPHVHVYLRGAKLVDRKNGTPHPAGICLERSKDNPFFNYGENQIISKAKCL